MADGTKIEHVGVMSDEWYPTDYVDEVVPAARESAQAWVEQHGEGWRIAPLEPSCEDSFVLTPVDGALINFCRCERLGEATLTTNADGTWHVDRLPSAGTNTITLDHDVAIGETLEDVVKQLYEHEGLKPGETYELSYSTWDKLAYRFDAATGHLTPADETAVH